jgi:hypothetical protein
VTAYLPLVFVAIVIIVIAAGARNLIENSLGGLSYARVLANLASGFILAIGVIAALDQLHIAAAVVNAIQPLVQAAAAGQRVADLARGQYWIHPALSEVVENALLKLPLEPATSPAG